ncbi:hypothetical protein cypCar_00000864 [Cyprinus carpio]|nr:hypothetical protein cypCar_00000864 [Cyprinus carpio]
MEEEMEQRKEREANKRQEVLKLTLEQKELWRSRLKLLCYLDHLATYEEILGGPHAAEQRFDAEFFKKFRNQNIVLSARTYSRESNVQALDILFTYYGSEQLQHQHVVLFNFPETTSPHEHSDLLPKAGVDKKGNLSFIPWEESRHRDLDWCEVPECRGVVEPDPVDDCHFLYEEQPELERFCSTKPSITLLTEWYLTRAQDIESNSRQYCSGGVWLLLTPMSRVSVPTRPESDTTKALHDQVDTLEKHLSPSAIKANEKERNIVVSRCVVEVLEKHGLQKPISFMRNSQNSKEEAHRLMVLLTRHTGHKNPPVRERVWRSLLQDLLHMLQNVYTCPEPETCHQVFVESLLCSGREENIRLAGQLMHCSAVSEDTPVSVSLRGKAHARVSYSCSMELILAAARAAPVVSPQNMELSAPPQACNSRASRPPACFRPA